MELELGLKITKTVDDYTSTNLNISKARGCPLFLSRETDTMFILTSHLKGYTRNNIKIDINEDGTKITIRGEKPVQEMVMVGWELVKKGIEMRGFQKSFKIPNGVVLDKIKAKFNDESILTISIPKVVKGIISGVGLEEEKEDEVLEGDSQSSEVVNDEAKERETPRQENKESEVKEVQEMNQMVEKLPQGNQSQETEEEIKEVCDSREGKENNQEQKETTENGFKDSDIDSGSTKCEPHQVIEQKESEKASIVEENRPIDEIPQVESENKEEKNEIEEENKCDHKEEKNEIEEEKKCDHKEEKNEIEEEKKCDHKEDDKAETSRVSQPTNQDQQNEDRPTQEDEFGESNIQEDDSSPRVEEDSPCGRSKFCVPIVVGSTLIVSFIVFVFHLIRSKSQTSRRRN